MPILTKEVVATFIRLRLLHMRRNEGEAARKHLNIGRGEIKLAVMLGLISRKQAALTLRLFRYAAQGRQWRAAA